MIVGYLIKKYQIFLTIVVKFFFIFIKIDSNNYDENQNQNSVKGGNSNRKNFSTINLTFGENQNSDDRFNKGKQIPQRNNGEYVSSTSFYGSYYNNQN